MESNEEETDKQLSKDNIIIFHSSVHNYFYSPIIENDSEPQAIIWQPGQKLYGDRYTIIKAQRERTELGSGGFGITYLARDNQGREVVIKTLNERAQTSPKFAKIQQDFRDEATRLGYCKHPHIVQIENKFDVGQLPCIVLEYIKGETLWHRVNNQGALSEAEALLYIRQIGEALIVVHGKGLLHRDVNPNNIILRADRSEAVLIDFGISKEYIPDLMQQYTVAFTECFSPLEQYDDNGKYGNYTDVYALAATMFYLVTGKSPTPPANRMIKDDFIAQKLDTINISYNVKNAILKGMALDSKNRPQSVDEWLKCLEYLDNRNVNFWSMRIANRVSWQTRKILFTNLWNPLISISLIFLFSFFSILMSWFLPKPRIINDIQIVWDTASKSIIIMSEKKIASKYSGFYCKLRPNPEGGGDVWTVMYSSETNTLPFLKIVSTLSGNFTPIQHCTEISSRLNNYSEYGLTQLTYRTDSQTPGQYVICVKTKFRNDDCLFLVALKPGSNPSETLKEMFKVFEKTPIL